MSSTPKNKFDEWFDAVYGEETSPSSFIETEDDSCIEDDYSEESETQNPPLFSDGFYSTEL